MRNSPLARSTGDPLNTLAAVTDRKPKLTPRQQKEAIKRGDQGEPVAEIARSYNVHHSTISSLTF